MTTEPVAPPHEEKEKEASSDPCSNACAAMGLDHVLKTVQKVWTDVSHTGFLGNMSGDTGAEHGSSAGVLNTKALHTLHAENTRRMSSQEPRSPAADANGEEFSYSHEEEMAGRLHEEMLQNSKNGSQANLAAAA